MRSRLRELGVVFACHSIVAHRPFGGTIPSGVVDAAGIFECLAHKKEHVLITVQTNFYSVLEYILANRILQ